MNRKPTSFGQALAVALSLALGSLSPLATPSVPAQTARLTSGELSTSGRVTVNGTAALNGVSVFSKTHVKTDREATATVNLGQRGRIELGPETGMTLRFSDHQIGGTLLAGRAVVSAPAGIAVSVVTADGVAASDGQQPVVLTIDLTRGNTRVAASRSGAQVTSGMKVKYVAAGQEVAVGASAADQSPSNSDSAKKTGQANKGVIIGVVAAGAVGAAVGLGSGKSSDKVSSGDPPVSQSKP